MRSIRIVLAFAILICAATAMNAQAATSAPTRIGVYDSRAVALAYYNSDAGRAQIVQLMTDLKKARDEGNAKQIQLLETKGPALQTLMHQQVFGSLSIPNVMATLGGALPAVAQAAGVAAIVSKWDVSYKAANVEYVDVTPQLVDALKPSDRVRKMIAEMAGKEPLPIDKLLEIRPEQ